ncbi:MAG TPA: vanadium-dependent haloperoxidase [Polyangiaceae bacterium]|nr:vanadium-dependent haloperoxidase [Polyangiaceae bacterium]
MRTKSTHAHSIAIAFFAVGASTGASARADTVTDWNQYTVEATKGFTGSATAGAGVTLDTNAGSRVEAIEARAVFDAVDSIDHFSSGYYYYSGNQSGSAAAAVVTAAHDVILAELPDPATDATADPRWAGVRDWVDAQSASDLNSLGVSTSDSGVAAGHLAAAAAVAARSIDGAIPLTSYGAQLAPTTNPGVGLWRQSNAGAPYVDPITGAPTGFDSTGAVIQGKPGVDLNWRDVAPFALDVPALDAAVRLVPPSPAIGSREYQAELGFVTSIGKDTSASRTADETAQALYYKQDAEIFANELARVASSLGRLKLDQNAVLFALLDEAIADARIGAFSSKYEQKFWRPITAVNADANGRVTNNYVLFHPLAATPSHPSNTSGHSAVAAVTAEILRASFGSDRISPNGKAVTLGSLPWLAGTNSGTGNVATRSVSTFTELQLEAGASRIYLGVHFGFDNLQGQILGLAVADAVLRSGDPAARGLHVPSSSASQANLQATLLSRRDLYGYYGFDAGHN